MGFTTETTKVKINEHDKGGGESIQTGKEKKKKKEKKKEKDKGGGKSIQTGKEKKKKKTRKEKERGKSKQKKNRTANVCGKISSGITHVIEHRERK